MNHGIMRSQAVSPSQGMWTNCRSSQAGTPHTRWQAHNRGPTTVRKSISSPRIRSRAIKRELEELSIAERSAN